MSKCETCEYCKQVYQRGYYKLYRVGDKYYCGKHEMMTTKDYGCSSWLSARCKYDLSPERYAQIEEDIRYIGEMCHDDDDEF